MIICDLCGKTTECSKRRIEGKEFDICADCWAPLAAKLKGKGRTASEREMVLVPPSSPRIETAEPEPFREYPPKIWGRAPAH
jgi:ribosome-binding protein aMBF1 (putative translation factor)